MEPVSRDPKLWRIAKARAKFKSHAVTYLLVNAFLWGVWYLTGHDTDSGPFPWPVWPTVFWGIGLTIQGMTTYGLVGRTNWSEREYERLVRQREER